MDLASKLFKGDRVIWVIFMFLCLISVVEVFSATSTIAYKNVHFWAPIVRHASFLLAGFFLVLVLHNIPCKYFSLFILLLPVSIFMLLITPFVGVRANDAHRWLELFGVQFQPSEFAKLACIVFVSFILSKRAKFTNDKALKYILIGVGIACILILPENFSTALLLFGVCYLMMFIGQLPLIKLGKLAVVLILALIAFIAVLYFVPENVFKQYFNRATTWKERVVKFADHEEKMENGDTYVINDDNYQVSHAKIAIARGGILGQLPGHSVQRDFLPQAYSDFIYAIIIEELGLVGGVFVLLLYVMLLIRVGMIAKRCDKLFPKYLVLGCGLLVVVQAIANMAVAVNLIPVTGQPLPLISRGGTSTMISCIYFGIILSVSRYSAHIGEEDAETDEEETTDELNPPKNEELTADEPEKTEAEAPSFELEEENPLKAVGADKTIQG